MKEYIQRRSPSATMVVFVLIMIMLLEEGITYSVFLGRLAAIAPGGIRVITPAWLAVRVLLMTWVIVMWILNRKRQLFTAIVWTNGFLTLILITNAASLISVLSGASQKTIQIVMLDMFALAISNVLIFSIWYWIMDPPGIDSDAPSNAPWDFLFPQRGNVVEQYENWRAALLGLPLPGFHHFSGIQPDRHPAAQPPGEDADAPANGHLGDHHRVHRRRRDQYPLVR